jgi:hypothetical protein
MLRLRMSMSGDRWAYMLFLRVHCKFDKTRHAGPRRRDRI